MTPQAARDHSLLFQVLLQATTGAFSILVATGIFLLFFYQPSIAETWADLYDISDTWLDQPDYPGRSSLVQLLADPS